MKIKIDFFAKMPSHKGNVYFEYQSTNEKDQGAIRRSYIDFAIEYKNIIVMVEVKSEDSDYNEEKTEDLKNAYAEYMKIVERRKRGMNKTLALVLYTYSDDYDRHTFHYFKNNQ